MLRCLCPRIDTVTNALPPGFATLRAQAHAEGHRMLGRLGEEWEAHTTRFDGAGEALLAAYWDNASRNSVLAGIGGMTIDPSIASALRMRRFYVAPAYRRCGVARRLALALLGIAGPTGLAVTVNASTQDASSFWESLGFAPIAAEGISHILQHRPQPGLR